MLFCSFSLLLNLSRMMMTKTKKMVKRNKAIRPTMELAVMSMTLVEEVAWNCSMVGEGRIFEWVGEGTMMEKILLTDPAAFLMVISRVIFSVRLKIVIAVSKLNDVFETSFTASGS
jgi:hypothetical protein